MAAIAGNIWSAYESNGVGDDALGMLITQCLDGSVLTGRINDDLLLCLYCKGDIDIGTLKAKGDAMVDYLAEPLSSITIPTSS